MYNLSIRTLQNRDISVLQAMVQGTGASYSINDFNINSQMTFVAENSNGWPVGFVQIAQGFGDDKHILKIQPPYLMSYLYNEQGCNEDHKRHETELMCHAIAWATRHWGITHYNDGWNTHEANHLDEILQRLSTAKPQFQRASAFAVEENVADAQISVAPRYEPVVS